MSGVLGKINTQGPILLMNAEPMMKLVKNGFRAEILISSHGAKINHFRPVISDLA
jgi:hypothetical protein